MAEIFENTNFDEVQTNTTLTAEGFTAISDYSTFPEVIDNLKTININSVGFNQIQSSLKRYYDLLIKFLNNPGAITSAEKEELNKLTKTISNYTLTSGDYVILRDALLETQKYLENVSNNLTGESGVYQELTNSLNAFEDKLNEIISQVNEIYQVSNGEVTNIFPEGSITEYYLSEELKNSFNYLEVTNGIYIDRSNSSEINWPKDSLSVPPMIIKIKNG